MKKFLTYLLLFFAVLVFATWQYRLLCVLLLIIINKEWVKSLSIMKQWKYSFRLLVWGLVLAIFIAIPNYFQRGRTQLLYVDAQGQRTSAPLHIYLVNALLPEEEAVNFAVKASAILPAHLLSPIFKNLGSRFIKDLKTDFWKGKAFSFFAPYNRLSLQGSNPGSFAYAQACNEWFDTNYDGIYVTKPSHYDKEKKYPVVFFAHGYLGSWELYQGVFSNLNNCFVVSIGTRDLSGIFSYNDINKIFTTYLPLLKTEGFNVDENHIHLIGLSNGGSASNVALRNFSNRFQTITYLSTSCDVTKQSKAKVLLIGSGKDASAVGLPSSSQRLQRSGTRTALFFDDEDNHYLMVHQRGKIIDFLNREMELGE